MDKFQPKKITRQAIDNWPVCTSGLSARVVHCLEEAKVENIGQLRTWGDQELLNLTNFGSTSLENVRWFFNWTRRLEAGNGQISNFRALLREFLNTQEVFVVEQRYGLTDPLFRPHMKRRTLQEIARMRIRVTRERVRQIEESAIAALRSHLARCVAETQEVYWANRILAGGCVVTCAELSQWAGDPAFGGYQPWGSLLLISETLERITFRYDYFSILPGPVLNQVEKQILQMLHASREPVPFEKILASVSDELSFLNGQRPRLVTVLLDHHPEISGTTDRRYFLPMVGAPLVIADILRGQPEPVHFHELTRLYNERMQPHSRKGTGYILRVLNLMPEAQRVSRAVYQLKA
ncbi:MAG TPA: DNA-directed RNA polymerase subunit alpha C-terminal domain-containing protein [Verrucomicrobiae bacterium]|nr:DNA-directed RNA polymerase subunit alpha C-terminal domain-containing protein [Verrucomicrobiae bacterium]